MSDNAIANYMFANDYNSNVVNNADNLTSSLDNALSEYIAVNNLLTSNIDEIDNLKSILENIKNIRTLQENTLLESDLTISNITNGLSTFNIYPSGSYKKYTSILNWNSDAEAIRSDWKSVGDDLKLSWSSLLLQKMNEKNVEE